MSLCGTVYPSTGVGTNVLVYTGNCTQMVFTGNAAGTTVTVHVIPQPHAPAPPNSLTLGLNNAGTQAIATWQTPPSNITTTLVQTSSDGVTWSNYNFYNAPTNTASFPVPSAGTTLYVRVKWEDVSGPFSAFTAPVQLTAGVSTWAKQVVTNGGAMPSASTQSALSTFMTALKNASIDNMFYCLNVIVPDSLIAAQTPIIQGSGSALWTNNGGNLVAGDLSINGLKGNALNKWLNTGCPENAAPIPVMGITIYVTATNNSANQFDMGVAGTVAPADIAECSGSNGSNQYGGVLPNGSNGVGALATSNLFTGYMSLNRLSTTNLQLYSANSTTPHSSVASNATTPTGFSANIASTLFFLAVNGPSLGVPNAPSGRTFSLGAYHQPFSLSQSAAFYNAFQALRTSLGGGFV